MIFSEPRFLALFAVCWLLFVSVPARGRSAVLALTGLAFYALYAGWFVVMVLGLTAAAVVSQRRWQLSMCGAAIILMLAWFKAPALSSPNSTASDVLIPLGFSYLSFELLHVVIERRRGRLADIGFIDLMAFIFFMPCRMAGPIRRFPDFAGAVQAAAPSVEDIYQGVVRILIGSAKKLIVADTLGLTVAEAPFVRTQAHAWTVVLAYSIHILFDFSAYSDMAIGFARLLGIRVPENFNYPYLAVNIRDFWNRWHITLSHWVRDYVFVPSSRALFGTLLRPHPMAIAACSYLLTFLVVGLWHGVTIAFVVWGLYHGTLLALHHIIQARMPVAVSASAWYRSSFGHALGCAITFFLVTLGWVPFMVDLDHARVLLRLMLLGDH